MTQAQVISLSGISDTDDQAHDRGNHRVNGKRPSPRTIRLAGAGTAAAALLAGFAAVAGAGLSSSTSSASEYQYGPGSHQYGHKVTICHHTHSSKHPLVTITVGAPAAAHHLKHGDTLGACPAATPPAGANKHDRHGKSDQHGNGNQNGNTGNDNGGNDNAGHGSGHGNNGHGHGK
jgi:hypothetical protein